MEGELQGEVALEECQERRGGPEEKKEVQETERRAKLGNPLARFSQEKMVARGEEREEAEEDVGDQTKTHHQLPHDHTHPQSQRAQAHQSHQIEG